MVSLDVFSFDQEFRSLEGRLVRSFGNVEATRLRLRRLTRLRTDSFLFKSDIHLSVLLYVSANGMDVVKPVHVTVLAQV